MFNMRMFAGALLVAAFAASALAQVPMAEKRPGPKTDSVQYLYPEQVTVPAGQPSSLVLHFRVAQGLHINSHTPKDEFLIPTILTIPEDSGVKMQSASYPPGADFTLPVEPHSRLAVYTGEFAIRTRIVAQPGDHLVEARLHYQACDANACLPPRTVKVPIDVVGK